MKIFPIIWFQRFCPRFAACLPFGIVAIIFAAQVNSRLAAGDRAGALDASNKAKLFTLIAFILGFLGSAIYAILMILAIVAEQGGR